MVETEMPQEDVSILVDVLVNVLDPLKVSRRFANSFRLQFPKVDDTLQSIILEPFELGRHLVEEIINVVFVDDKVVRHHETIFDCVINDFQ